VRNWIQHLLSNATRTATQWPLNPDGTLPPNAQIGVSVEPIADTVGKEQQVLGRAQRALLLQVTFPLLLRHLHSIHSSARRFLCMYS
jgi:hypothetical protein